VTSNGKMPIRLCGLCMNCKRTATFVTFLFVRMCVRMMSRFVRRFFLYFRPKLHRLKQLMIVHQAHGSLGANLTDVTA